MKISRILFFLTVALGIVFFACQKDKVSNPPAVQQENIVTNTNPDSFLLLHITPGDSIDSSGVYYLNGNTTYWVLKDTAGKLDTVGAVITVSHDTASVTGLMYPGFTTPLNIVGKLASGPGVTFEGSVWKAVSISTVVSGTPVSTDLAPGTDLYLYFKPGNHKIYVLDVKGALSKLALRMVLQCPLAFLGPAVAAQIQGASIDSARSTCDTMWLKMSIPPITLHYFVVSNFDSLSLDVYWNKPPATFVQRIPVSQLAQ